MAQQETCQSCGQKHNCQEIFQQLGGKKGPSVALKAAIAFLLPIIVFVAILTVSEANFAKMVNNKQLQTAIGVLLALSVTFIFVVSYSSLVTKRKQKKK